MPTTETLTPFEIVIRVGRRTLKGVRFDVSLKAATESALEVYGNEYWGRRWSLVSVTPCEHP